MTLNERSESFGHRAAGFDWLRIGLAVAILFWHAWSSSLGEAASAAAWASPIKALPTVLLPMFFALSGYLVSGSLERSRTIASFLWLRLIRIVPALAVETAFAALLIGPLVTTLALGAYFADADFLGYFTNIIGLIQYDLPGVFASNPRPDVVNAQLWTIPFELECYLVLSVVALAGVYRSGLVMAVLGVVAAVWAAAMYVQLDAPAGPVPGRGLVACFVIGVALYRFRTRVPHSAPLFAACLAVSGVLCSLPGGGLLAAAPLAYVTVWLGLTNPALPKVLRTGDYSYGIFLYHFAVQQFLVASFSWAHNPVLNALVSLVLSTALAVLSWHLVEKRAARLRTFTSRLDALFLRRSASPQPAPQA